MENSALIFIPDISGFTKFVTETEINHSQHIIKELIEVIVKSLSPGLIVSEIEGDAVLTYQFGKPPSYSELTELAKKIFLNFHSQLRIIERDNVCSCGACKGSSKLTLKFITHFGKLKEVEVANFKKLIGADLILAHRLLKNHIPLNEYLLLTEHFFKAQKNSEKIDDTLLTTNIEEFENFGKVETKYLDFSPFIDEVPRFPKTMKVAKGKSSESISVVINAPINLVHLELIDTKGKLNWMKNIKEINDTNKINRINAVHICKFDRMDLKLTTRANMETETEYFFQEDVEIKNGIEFINDFHLIKFGNETKLKYKITYDEKEHKSFFAKMIYNLKLSMVINTMLKSQKENLKNFKIYCEREKLNGRKI